MWFIHMGRSAYRVWWGKLKKGDRLEDLDVDGKILKWA
jgi:hypothetical protein